MKKILLLTIAFVLAGLYSFAQWEWQNPSPQGSWLNSVVFTDVNTGYAVGDWGTIIKTINGGTTWITQPSGTSENLNSVFFTDSNTGYVVGSGGTILKTTNGGGPAVGINEPPRQTNNLQNSLKIYPNPATDKITIEPSEADIIMNGTVSVYGMTGQQIVKQHVPGQRLELNVSALPVGIYFVRMVNNEKIEFGKFIKE
jgi:hypothetical protein